MWCFRKGLLKFRHACNPCITKTCHLANDVAAGRNEISGSHDTAEARPFDEIPGPKSLPFIGSLWNYLPIFG
jgi:hypothetical protein